MWGPDLVIHLAAQSSAGQSDDLAELTWRTNAVGALNLAAAVDRLVPEATVFNVSSGEVYGSTFLKGPPSETSPLSPTSIYARSKAAAEAIFEDVLPREMRLVTVRPLNQISSPSTLPAAKPSTGVISKSCLTSDPTFIPALSSATPEASDFAWIFVVKPPRERPGAWPSCPFWLRPPTYERARRWSRTSE